MKGVFVLLFCFEWGILLDATGWGSVAFYLDAEKLREVAFCPHVAGFGWVGKVGLFYVVVNYVKVIFWIMKQLFLSRKMQEKPAG